MANTYSGGSTANVGNNAYYFTIDGTDSGLCSAPLNFVPTIETLENQFLQDSSPRSAQVSKQTLEIDVTLAEVTDANFKKYLGNLATISGANLYFGDQKGEFLDTFEIILYPLHKDGHPWAGRALTLHKAYIVPNGGIVMDPTDDAFEGFPIKIVVVKDTSQSAGEEFFTMSASVATAPTVSSPEPVDGATGVAIDASIGMTFSIAMAAGTITTDNIFIMKTDFSASVEITSITLSALNTIATLAHGDLANATEYSVFVTEGVRSAAGVHMVSPFEWDFTTVA